VESKMRDLRRDNDNSQQQEQQPKKQQPSSRNEAAPETGLQAQQQERQEVNATEVSDLKSLDPLTAGPRRSTASAGYDGRSLA
jgi:hypothetical protein